MKIYPIAQNFKSASFKNNIKNKEISPQKNPIEKDALFLLSNYGKGSLNLSFKGDCTEKFKQYLSQKNFNDNDISDFLKVLDHVNKEVIPIQIDLAKTFLQDGRFSAEQIKCLIGFISHDKENAEIQSNITKSYLEDGRFDGEDIACVLLRTRYSSKENALLMKELTNKLMKNKNLGHMDITDIIAPLSFSDDISRKQKKIILKLANKGFFDDPNQIKENIKNVNSMTKYISKKPESDVEKLFDYMEKIDFEKIEKMAPLMKHFGFEGRFNFCEYHYAVDGKTEFDEKDLAYQGDLNELFSNNFFNQDSLNDLYSIFPLTKREIGNVPQTWLEKVPDDKKEEAINKIYKAIYDFQDLEDENKFSKEMSEILGKKVETERIGSGEFGICYKISVENSLAVCLKVFFPRNTPYPHGAHFEVQAGYFASKNSPDFVKMYFGAVAPARLDHGFIVTQFLDKNTKIDNSGCQNLSEYQIMTDDAYGEHNRIQGKIIDYGGIKVQDRKTGFFADPCNVLSLMKESV